MLAARLVRNHQSRGAGVDLLPWDFKKHSEHLRKNKETWKQKWEENSEERRQLANKVREIVKTAPEGAKGKIDEILKPYIREPFKVPFIDYYDLTLNLLAIQAIYQIYLQAIDDEDAILVLMMGEP